MKNTQEHYINLLKYNQEKEFLHPQVENLIQFLASNTPIPSFFTIQLNQNSELVISQPSNSDVYNKEFHSRTINPTEQLLLLVPYEHWKKFVSPTLFFNSTDLNDVFRIAFISKNIEFLEDVFINLHNLYLCAFEEKNKLNIENPIHQNTYENYQKAFSKVALTVGEAFINQLPYAFIEDKNTDEKISVEKIEKIHQLFLNSSNKFNYFFNNVVLKESIFNPNVEPFKISNSTELYSLNHDSSLFEWICKSNKYIHRADDTSNSKITESLSLYSIHICQITSKFIDNFLNIKKNNNYSINTECLELFLNKFNKPFINNDYNLSKDTTLIHNFIKIDSIVDSSTSEHFLQSIKISPIKKQKLFDGIFYNIFDNNYYFEPKYIFNQSGSKFFTPDNYFYQLQQVESLLHNNINKPISLPSVLQLYFKPNKFFQYSDEMYSEKNINFMNFSTALSFLSFLKDKQIDYLSNTSTINDITLLNDNHYYQNKNLSFLYDFYHNNDECCSALLNLISKQINNSHLNNIPNLFDEFLLSISVNKSLKSSKKLKF